MEKSTNTSGIWYFVTGGNFKFDYDRTSVAFVCRVVCLSSVYSPQVTVQEQSSPNFTSHCSGSVFTKLHKSLFKSSLHQTSQVFTGHCSRSVFTKLHIHEGTGQGTS